MTNDLRQRFECPTFNKHRSAASQIRYQVLSVIAPFFWRPFWIERCENGACIDLFVLFHCLKTLVDRIQFTFNSSLCTIWSSIWWHTSGENIDIYIYIRRYESTTTTGKPLLSSRLSCYLANKFWHFTSHSLYIFYTCIYCKQGDLQIVFQSAK